MRRFGVFGVLAAVLAVAACSSESKGVTGPPIGPPDSVPTDPGHNPQMVLYAVPQRQAEAILHVSSNRVHASSEGGVTQEPWNADSIVYVVGDSTGAPTGDIVLNLVAHVADFNNPDSAGVANTQVQWVVLKDKYSQDPQSVDPRFGLGSASTTTDATGTTVNTMTFDQQTLANVDHGYFYVEARLADSTGALIKSAKFYIINWQQPTWIAYWDGAFPQGGFDKLKVEAPVDTGSQTVTLTVSDHITFPVFEGADTFLGSMNVGQVEAEGCTVVAQTITCPVSVLPIRVNVWPDLTMLPAGVNALTNPADAHTFFQLNAAP